MTSAAIERGILAAVRRVARLYDAAPEPEPPVEGSEWWRLEREVDRAVAASNQTQALAAIAAWERFAEEQLRPAVALGARPDHSHPLGKPHDRRDSDPTPGEGIQRSSGLGAAP